MARSPPALAGEILIALSEVKVADAVRQVDVAEVVGVNVLTKRRYRDKLKLT